MSWASDSVVVRVDPKRGLKRGRNPPLSCTNAIGLQVNLDGKIPTCAAPVGRYWLAVRQC
jgi:hypothetical protein